MNRWSFVVFITYICSFFRGAKLSICFWGAGRSLCLLRILVFPNSPSFLPSFLPLLYTQHTTACFCGRQLYFLSADLLCPISPVPVFVPLLDVFPSLPPSLPPKKWVSFTKDPQMNDILLACIPVRNEKGRSIEMMIGCAGLLRSITRTSMYMIRFLLLMYIISRWE